MNPTNRRTFLGQAAAVPLVFGLADPITQDSKDEEPKWFPAALARMKETGRWGLGIVLQPDLNRFWWGQGLWALTAFPDEDVDAHEIFCESVVMILTPEFVRKKFSQDVKVHRILLSPDGKRIASDEVDPMLVRDSTRFAESFREFLHGPKNERLIERAKAIDAGLPDELKRTAQKLNSESVDERTLAAAALARKAETLTPYLAWLEHVGEGARQRRAARNFLSSYFASLQTDAAGSKLPFGCTGPHHYDPCPSCGMGRRPLRSSMMLKFLVPGAPPPKKEDD
jgi:hypothetical protein